MASPWMLLHGPKSDRQESLVSIWRLCQPCVYLQRDGTTICFKINFEFLTEKAVRKKIN